MKIRTQIFLLLGGIMTAVMIHRAFVAGEKKQIHSPDESSMEEKANVRVDSEGAKGSVSQASKQASAVLPKAKAVDSAQDLQTIAEALKRLDAQTHKVINFLSSSEKKERDFLLNQVGLSKEDYLEVQTHQKQVYAQLRDTEAWAKAFGINPDEAKKPILEKHVLWMERKLGVGYYAQFQELTLSQFSF